MVCLTRYLLKSIRTWGDMHVLPRFACAYMCAKGGKKREHHRRNTQLLCLPLNGAALALKRGPIWSSPA